MSEQIIRQWGVLGALRDAPQGLTVRELAERFGASKNTLDRDLKDLLEAGFALEQQKVGKAHVFRLVENTPPPSALPTTLELLALHAARSQLAPLAGTPLFADLSSLLQKARTLAGAARFADGVTQVFLPHVRAAKSYEGEAQQEIIDTLVDAVLRHRACTGLYRSATAKEPRVHRLRPLRLFFHLGGLYLYAAVDDREPGKDALLTFAVERFLTLDETEEVFDPPAVDIDAQLAQAFGVTTGAVEQVEVRFSADVRLYVEERTWHPTQKLEALPGGGLRFTAELAGKHEFLRWVLSWGRDAELLAPPSWRAELADHAAALAARYG